LLSGIPSPIEPGGDLPPAFVVVDDDPASLAGLVRDLEHRYDRYYQVFGAATAEAGLEILERLRAVGHPVALVIADLWMPGTTGPQVLIGARQRHPNSKRAVMIDAWDFGSNEALGHAMTLGQAGWTVTDGWSGCQAATAVWLTKKTEDRSGPPAPGLSAHERRS
jgi:thioredoxin reductase (NADPH)